MRALIRVLLCQAGQHGPLLIGVGGGAEASEPALTLLQGEARVVVDRRGAWRALGGRSGLLDGLGQGAERPHNPAAEILHTRAGSRPGDHVGDLRCRAVGQGSGSISADPDCEQLALRGIAPGCDLWSG